MINGYKKCCLHNRIYNRNKLGFVKIIDEPYAH